MPRRAFTSVIRAPGVAWLLGTSLVARIPVSMVALSIVLIIARAAGSYTTAGLVAGTFVVGAALFGPVMGRLADRYGRRPVLVLAAFGSGVGQVVLSRIPVHDTGDLLLAAVLAGASTPPVSASVRSLWPELVPAELRDNLYGIDSSIQELTFIVGPVLVAVIGSTIGAAAPLEFSGALGFLGTVAVVAHPAIAVRKAPSGDHRLPRAPSRPVITLIGAFLLLVCGFGVFELGVVAFATRHHDPGAAGLLLAVWSFGSLVGGALVGSRASAGGSRLIPWLLAATAAGFALSAAAPVIAVLFPLIFIAGMAIAPSLGSLYRLAGQFAPPGGAVETFSWLSSGIMAGGAVGGALGGLVVQHLGSRGSDFVAGTAVLLSAAVTLGLPSTRRDLVGPREATAETSRP